MRQQACQAVTAPPSLEALAAENAALRQRLDELERRALLLEQDQAPFKSLAMPALNLTDLATTLPRLLAVLLLAAGPAVLVVADRWLGNRAPAAFFREPWCSVGVLCQLAFPPYFALLIPCLLALLVLLALRPAEGQIALFGEPPGMSGGEARRASPEQARLGTIVVAGAGLGVGFVFLAGLFVGRLPNWELVALLVVFVAGWLLREVSPDDILKAWQRRRRAIVATALVHVALIGLLASLSGALGPPWIPALIFVLAGASLLSRSPRPGLGPLLVALALVLYTLQLDAWWFAVVGDEYAFYRYATEITERQSLGFIGAHLFAGQAVYEAHPYLSSLLQALSIKLFGATNFGWRFSSLYLAALSVGLLFSFFRAFVGFRVALVAGLFLAASHYLMSFGKIGYNNLQALFAFALALWAAAWAVRTGRPISFVVLGLSLGGCFYVYPAALYAVPVPLLLLLFYLPPTSGLAVRRWATLGLSLLILVSPLLLQPGYWESKLPGTLLINPQLARSSESTGGHVVANLVYAFFSPFWIPDESHFVAVGYTDPLTAGFLFIGLGCVLGRARRERFAAFLALAFGLLLFLVGASHDRRFPPVTRMFLLLPWFALLAAIGLEWIIGQLIRLGLRPRLAPTIAGLAVAGVIGLNLYQAYPLSRDRLAPRYQQFGPLFLRLASPVLAERDRPPKTFVFLNNPVTINLESLRELLRLYGLPFESSQLVELPVADSTLSAAWRSIIADQNALVVVDPRLAEATQRASERVLSETGKQPCRIRDTVGAARFSVWHAPELAPLCGRMN